MATAAEAATSTEPSVLTAALATLHEMPRGWRPYQPSPTPLALSKGTCGRPLFPHSQTPDGQAFAAYALDPTKGPLFGERIEQFSNIETARQLLARRSPRGLPCSWFDAGIKWKAAPEPRLRAGDEAFPYLLRKLSGDYPYNYETTVRRGATVLEFVVNSRRSDRALSRTLVRRAVARFDAQAGSTA